MKENRGGKEPLLSEEVSLTLATINDQTLFTIRTANTKTNGWGISEEIAYTMDTTNGQAVAYAIPHNIIGRSDTAGGNGKQYMEEESYTLDNRGTAPAVNQQYAVRRLTPVECERLQGFPDGWTQIAYKGKAKEDCPDGPRYKALGNSMTVPCMRWIGERIQKIESDA